MYGHMSFQKKIRKILRGKHKKAKIETGGKIVGVFKFIYL
jgi:hypothetical protein